MIRTILIDDESKSRTILRSLLAETSVEIQIVGEADGYMSAIELITNEKPDLVFLDIELGADNGFDLLRHYPDPFFQVIFVSAHSEYAVKAFKFTAVDYLLKPVDPEELTQALMRMKKRWQQGMEVKFEQKKETPASYLEFSIRDEILFVKPSDILYLEARGAYTMIFFADGTQNLYTINIGQLEKKLESLQFFRVHRSYIINLSYIKKIVKEDRVYALMENGEKLEISRRNRTEFFERLRTSYDNHL